MKPFKSDIKTCFQEFFPQVRKALLSALIFAFFVVLLQNQWQGLFEKWFIPITSYLNFNLFTNIAFVIFVIALICKLIVCFCRKYVIGFTAYLLLLTVGVLYICYRSTDYVSYPICFCGIGYSDILCLMLFLFLIVITYGYWLRFRNLYQSEKLNKKEKTLNQYFDPDQSITDPKDDILDFQDNVESLIKYLPEDNDEPISIGILASWGRGKTSYLNLLKNSLNSSNKYIVLNFNPRHQRNTQTIQENFFNILFTELSKYDGRFSTSFKNYLQAINIINQKKILSLLFNVRKIWNRREEKDLINEALKGIKKKIVVIIDDLDRLGPDEIIEVLKLIDGTASFKNMIFITAYDKESVNRILRNKYSDCNSFFTDKYFNIEERLPLIPYIKIIQILVQKLFEKITMTKEDQEKYENLIYTYRILLQNYLPTIRDVKRYLNLFVPQYSVLKNDVEFWDFFLLYLIKYRNYGEYLSLFSKKYTNSKFSDTLTLKDELEKVKSIDVLKVLFLKKSNRKFRSINEFDSFDIYFFENLSGHLSASDIDRVFDGNEDLKKELQSIGSVNSKMNDFHNYITLKNVLSFQNKLQFERYIDVLLDLIENKYADLYVKFQSLCLNEEKEKVIKQFKYSEKKYKELITSKLSGAYPDYPYKIVRKLELNVFNNVVEIAQNVTSNNVKYIFNSSEMLSIAKVALKDLVSNCKKYSDMHYQLFLNCILKLDSSTTKITIDQDACLIIRELIESNPKGYFENFVILGMASSNPAFNTITCEAFWKQIFGNAENLKRFVDQHDSITIPKIDLVRNFWRLYENNNYQPIRFENQENVQSKINDGLQSEVAKLDKLDNIEKRFTELNNKSSEITPQKFKENCMQLLGELDKIDLYISKRLQINNMISSIIRKL